MSKEKRFEVVHEDKSLGELTRIMRDRETGVCYLYQWAGTGGGLTVLVDKDGKPIVMDGRS
ncbi:hypothetical protein EHF33_20935 (plasmid) [Deinococcus psychrotolerans]|uniref:DUF6440 domain-containing protein n=1 Tax=Deinococcus psychrotolerans TaxID=2489213 RepID=A0A3G8YJD7_9DEIO|nr:DUF6440 family protein [Deinococcus psychrotolerans]AZI45378.1 hypothetical protein EHF33_20935 [Deinococcus psychrotolerans]